MRVESSERQSLRSRVHDFRERHPVATTVAETALIYVGNELLKRGAARMGVTLGHGRRDSETRTRFIEDHPVVSAVLVNGVAPVMEELIFRKLPSDALDRRGDHRTRHDIGLIPGLLFATSVHGVKDAIPVPQFVYGQYLWHKQRTKGYGHAVLAHVAANILETGKYLMNKSKGKTK